MKTVKIECDYCQADLTVTNSMPRFRINVECEPLLHISGMPIFATFVQPPIDQPLHFCGLPCMRNYLAKIQQR
jgi:hypothetical protein